MPSSAKVSNQRKVVLSVDVPTTSWSTPIELDSVGFSGSISRVTCRFPASSTTTEALVKIYTGDSYDTSTDPGAVPDEDVVYESDPFAVTGSATLADNDDNVIGAAGGSAFDVRNRAQGQKMWVSIEGRVGTNQNNVALAIRTESAE